MKHVSEGTDAVKSALQQFSLSVGQTVFIPSNQTVTEMSSTLPETASLPSVPDFAECFLSDARQRVYLPSVREKALDKQLTLGKEVVCRVPSTRQK